jgi:RES domain-containing protein
MLTEVSGTFVKIVWADDPDIHLTRGAPDRPPARFNRLGQDALYLSPDVESARVAIGQDVKEGDRPRVLLTFDVPRCTLFDLRAPEAADIYALASQPWRKLLAAGGEPSSWTAADRLRTDGYLGLIDPSRRRPGLWHIALFQWNEPDAPSVLQVGHAEPVSVFPDYR